MGRVLILNIKVSIKRHSGNYYIRNRLSVSRELALSRRPERLRPRRVFLDMETWRAREALMYVRVFLSMAFQSLGMTDERGKLDFPPLDSHFEARRFPNRRTRTHANHSRKMGI